MGNVIRRPILAAAALTLVIAPAALLAETAGDGACGSCHPDRHREWARSAHARADAPGTGAVGCLSCHTPHTGNRRPETALDPARACDGCHPQRAVLAGKGARGVPETRSMHSAVACGACHMTGGGHGMNVIRPDDPDLPDAALDSCTACHKDNNRDTRAAQVRDYVSWYHDAMDPLEADLDAVGEAVKTRPEIFGPALLEKLDRVRANLSILVRDGSEGIHNIDFALEIMALAERDLAEIKKAAQGAP